MLKKIVLYGAALDSAQHFHDAGVTLEVSDTTGPGRLGAEQAQELIDKGRAVSVTQARETDKQADADAAGDPPAPVTPPPAPAVATTPRKPGK